VAGLLNRSTTLTHLVSCVSSAVGKERSKQLNDARIKQLRVPSDEPHKKCEEGGFWIKNYPTDGYWGCSKCDAVRVPRGRVYASWGDACESLLPHHHHNCNTRIAEMRPLCNCEELH